nr:hypothetical protein [Nanoarchaeota archaeon]
MKGLTKISGISAEEIKEVLDKKEIKYVEWHPELRQHTILGLSADIEYMAKTVLDKVIVTPRNTRDLIRTNLGNPNVTGSYKNLIMYELFYAFYQINSPDFIKSIPFFQNEYRTGYIRFNENSDVVQLTKVFYNEGFLE